MRRETLLAAFAAIVSFALLASLAQAEPAATEPTWCAGYKSTGDTNAKWVDRRLASEGFTLHTLEGIAKGACDAPQDAQRQADVLRWQKAWCARNACTGDDFADVMKLAMDPAAATKLAQAHCRTLAAAPAGSRDARALASVVAGVTGCAQKFDPDLGWWIDRAEISEMARTAWVASCLHTAEAEIVPTPTNRKTLLMQYLACGPDTRRMDRARLDTELADPRFNAYARSKARALFGRTKVLVDTLTADFRNQARNDERIRRLVFDAPEAADKAWRTSYQQHKVALDLAAELEGIYLGSMTKSPKGHSAALGRELADYVKQAAPKTYDQAVALATDAVGLPLITALAVADTLDDNNLAAAAAGEVVSLAKRERRGPRYAAYWAAIDALSETPTDRDPLPVASLGGMLPGPRAEFPKNALEKARRAVRPAKAEGVIKNVKPHAGFVTLTFTTESWQAPVMTCIESSKIDRIEANGQVVYRQDCRVSGQRTVTRTEEPVEVPTRYAAGLAPGQFVRLFLDEQSGRRGIPLETYADVGRKTLVGFLGIAL